MGSNAWRKSASYLAFRCFVLCLIRMETEGLLDYQGGWGIISVVQWNLRPVIFGGESGASQTRPVGRIFHMLYFGSLHPGGH